MIMRSYEKIALKPQIEVTDNAFKITLPNTNEIAAKALLSENERAVMALFEGKDSIVRKDVESALSVSQPMAVRVLKGLVDKGEIRTVGGGKNTRYVVIK
ncbi:MAG: hypothetical protein FWG30_10470 [Eubacteriaceae bacterium]|nr:hypothetical protein [Eubacteriaceae bacterium]